jgi:surfactin synthase thioesterase subunit
MSSDKIQVFLLHFAGGNCYSFQFLKPYFINNLEFIPLELPGRGKRMGDNLLNNESDAVSDYIRQMRALRNKKSYIIFGHSMGASLGLRVTKELENIGDPPASLVVAGNAGPGTGERKYRSRMNDEELKEELRTLGGVPEEVLENEDLFNFFAPCMRADFELLENLKELDAENYKIKTPITAVMGDEEKTANEIENWGRFAANAFRHKLLKGNHFFIHDHPAELVKIIKNSYDRASLLKRV